MRAAYLRSLEKRLKIGWRLPCCAELPLKECLEASSGMDLSSYLQDMAKPTTWGGFFEAAFMAYKHEVPSLSVTRVISLQSNF